MTLDPKVRRELVALAVAMTEGTADEAVHQRLYELIAKSDEAAWVYVQAMHMQAALRWDRSISSDEKQAMWQQAAMSTEEEPLGNEAGGGVKWDGAAPSSRWLNLSRTTRHSTDASLAAESDQCVQPAAHSRSSVQNTENRRRSVSMSVAAIVVSLTLLMMAVWTLPQTQKQLASDRDGQTLAPFVARLLRTHEVEWVNPATAVSEMWAIRAGHTLDIKAGLAELRFDDGARVILEGPITFTPQTDGRGRLEFGKLVARVPAEEPKAKGFVVETPSATITDLGTEFGVLVDEQGKADVHVFVGEIELAPTGTAKSGQPVRLTAGQMAHVGASGEIVHGKQADRNLFAHLSPFVNGRLQARSRRIGRIGYSDAFTPKGEPIGTNIAPLATVFTSGGSLPGYEVARLNDNDLTDLGVFITNVPRFTEFRYGVAFSTAMDVTGLAHFSGFGNRDNGDYVVEYTTDAGGLSLGGIHESDDTSLTWSALTSPSNPSFSITTGGATVNRQQDYFSSDAIAGVTAIRIRSSNNDDAEGSVAELRVYGKESVGEDKKEDQHMKD